MKRRLLNRNRSKTGLNNVFSVRKNNPAFNGNCMKVKRLSDGAELEIGFVSDYVDTSTLLSFANGGDCVVLEWYNQGHSSVNMKSINDSCFVVTGGVLEEVNGKLALVSTLRAAETLFYNDVSNNKWIYGSFTEIMAGMYTEIIGYSITDGLTRTGWGHFRGLNQNQARNNLSTQTYPNVSVNRTTPTINSISQNTTNGNSRMILNGVDSGVVTLGGAWESSMGFWGNGVKIQEILRFDFAADEISSTKQLEMCDEINTYFNYY